VQRLDALASSPTADGAAAAAAGAALLRRLQDDAPAVVLAALSATSLLKMPPAALFDGLAECFDRALDQVRRRRQPAATAAAAGMARLPLLPLWCLAVLQALPCPSMVPACGTPVGAALAIVQLAVRPGLLPALRWELRSTQLVPEYGPPPSSASIFCFCSIFLCFCFPLFLFNLPLFLFS
jgi:hypothetical protein